MWFVMLEPFLTVSEGAHTLSVQFLRRRYGNLDVNVTCAYAAGTGVPGTWRLSKTTHRNIGVFLSKKQNITAQSQ